VPFADYLLFRHEKLNRIALNLGGIANLTFLPAGQGIEALKAFDTGPGNCVSDYLSRMHFPDGPGWDENGAIAARGVVIEPLVKKVLSHPYFSRPGPKSTDGPEMIRLFTNCVAEIGRNFPPESLLRTACHISAESILSAMRTLVGRWPDELIVSGGGVNNQTLMSALRQGLGDMPLRTTDELGVLSQAKEAVAFALIAAATLDNVPANVPAATGARRAVVLGSITPRP